MMEGIETRAVSVEIRAAADGKTIGGILMPYGRVSESHRERFLPGSLRAAPRGVVNAGHDRSRAVSGWPGAVEFRETASGLEVDISMDDTPEAARAVEDIRARRLTGFSVEFTRAVSSVANGIREVKEAVLIGIGVVEVASYPDTAVQLRRARARVWIT